MIIARIEGATRVLGKSQGYLGLPIRDEVRNTTVDGEQTPVMVTAWEPTPDEIDRINCGAPVQLCVVGTGHPPVMLEVGEMPKDEVYEQVMAMSGDELRAELAAEGKTMEGVAAEGRAIFERAKAEADMRLAIQAWLKCPSDRRPSAQALGLLPNGIDWDHGDGFPNLPFCRGSRREPSRYIMCCGHVLSPKQAQQLVSAGLLDRGPPDRFARPTLVITPAGREWLRLNWREST